MPRKAKGLNLNYRIEEIPEEGVTLEGNRQPDWLEGLFSEQPWPDVKFVSPVVYQVYLSRSGSLVLIKGSINVTLELPCSRCLEKKVLCLEPDFEFTLTPANFKNFPHERELQKEELKMEFYVGDTIDLAQIIRNQVILSIPYNTLCNADCKGLCPSCGKNRNKESCECETTNAVDSRFMALQILCERKDS